MSIETDFSITTTGSIRHVTGTTVYSVLDLHVWLQALSDDEEYSGDDAIDIFFPNPSKIDGPRDENVATRLNLLTGTNVLTTTTSIIVNIDDDAAKYINFGSIKQKSSFEQYSGLKSIGIIVENSPVYVVQNTNKLTKYWANGHIQILIKVKTNNSFIDNGVVSVFSRKFGQSYSHFDVDLSAGGESSAAISTAIDPNTVLDESGAAALSSKVSITISDTTQDLLNGNGPKLYKGTISLINGCTLREAYQYLKYITREDSVTTINGVPGWRYRALNPSYTEVVSAPFGTFAGGTFFLAQGWWITGVLASESTNYQLIADDGSIQPPPSFISIEVNNLVNGDNVIVARSTGTAILKNEYTPISTGTGATSLTVVETIKSDTPSSGVIRIKEKRYSYSSIDNSTKTFNGLSPSLLENIVTSDDVFVPFIDTLTTNTVETVSFLYNQNFNARLDVRNGNATTPIVPFSSIIIVSASGASVNVNRNNDI